MSKKKSAPETELDTQPFANLVGEDVLGFIIKKAPTKVSTRFARALDHFTRASAQIGGDEEMGALRLIAAEEELVVAIFEWLKLKENEFSEHKDFVRKYKNHVVKLSFYPVLQQFRFALGDMLKRGFVLDGIEEGANFSAMPVVDGDNIKMAISDGSGNEIIRQDIFSIGLSQGDVHGEDVVPLLLSDFVNLVKDQHGGTLKQFLSERADFRNKLLYANDAESMGYMEGSLSDLIEVFKITLHDLLWVLAILIGGKPPIIKWGWRASSSRSIGKC